MSDSDDDSEVQFEEYAKFKSGKKLLKTCFQNGVKLYHCFYCSQQPKQLHELLAHAKTKKEKKQEHLGLALWLQELSSSASEAAPPAAHAVPDVQGMRSGSFKTRPLLTKQTTQGSRADETVWPPVLILANLTSVSADQQLIGNPQLRELVKDVAEDFKFDLIKAQKMHWDGGGRPTGKALLVFEKTCDGFLEADHFSRAFQRKGLGKDAYYNRSQRRGRLEPFGWLATVRDMDTLDRPRTRVKKWTTIAYSELRGVHTATKRKAEEMELEAKMWKKTTRDMCEELVLTKDEHNVLLMKHEEMVLDLEEQRREREELSQRLAHETGELQRKEHELRQECRRQVEAIEQERRQRQIEDLRAFDKKRRGLERAMLSLAKDNDRLVADLEAQKHLARDNQRLAAELADLQEQKQAFDQNAVKLGELHHEEKMELEHKHRKEMKALAARHQDQHSKLAMEACRAKEEQRTLKDVNTRLKEKVKHAEKQKKARTELEDEYKKKQEKLAREQSEENSQLELENARQALEEEKEEHGQLQMRFNIVTIDERGKNRKLLDFYDACKPAMSEGFITIKEFGKVDLEIIKAAYLEKKGVQPDNGCTHTAKPLPSATARLSSEQAYTLRHAVGADSR